MRPVIDPSESPVFQRDGRGPVRVTQPSSRWNLALGLAVCVVLGVIVFASLSAGRQAKAEAGPRPAAAQATPVRPAFIAAPAPALPIVPSLVGALPAAPPATPTDDPSRRWRSPVMVADLSDPAAAGPSPAAASASAPAEPAAESAASAEDRFAGIGLHRHPSAGATHCLHLRELTRSGIIAP